MRLPGPQIFPDQEEVMMKRFFTTLLLLICLAAAHACAAQDADTGAQAYTVQEKDEATSILTEPVRGRETGATGPTGCVLATGETRQADDGQTWMEITRPTLGWIPAKNVGEPSPACEAAYQVIDSLYETLITGGASPCAHGEYTSLADMPQIREWIETHSAPLIEHIRSSMRADAHIEEKPLDEVMDEILALFEQLPSHLPGCWNLSRDEFYGYFPAVISEEPDTFYFTTRENILDWFRTLHFRLTPEGAVVSGVEYQFLL